MGKLILKANLSETDNKKLKDEFSVRLADKLRDIRTKRGMKQEELANASTVHLTYISHLEAAKYHPSVFVMWKIAKALGVSMNELTDL
ncbi:MAG TPA: helix-turn-helix transcriptional regulator [Candidatus Saccharimonadales bacterium]|nr:helix-turn-helix transcriptional regulator [Candidatus Saccharimonadales bacterium]